MDSAHEPEARPVDAEVLGRLLTSHRDFLKFLQSRVRDPATAEEILQAAFVRALEKGGDIRDGESAVAWFYRLLRNALVDHYRRGATQKKALAQHAIEANLDLPSEAEVKDAICACMNTLLPNLKPEYADVLRRADLEEKPLSAVATDLAITTNNATVRLHRARQALKRELERSCGTCATHGCLDCACGSTGHGAAHA